MATLQDQLEWESKHRKLGQLKMEEVIQKAETKGRIADTPIGKVVLRKYLMWLSQRISKDITTDLEEPGRCKAYSPLLLDLDPDKVALIALSVLINTIHSSDTVPLNTAGFAIGKEIYGELVLSQFEDLAPDMYEVLREDLKRRMSSDLRHRLTVYKMQAAKMGLNLVEWSPSQKLQVGAYLLGLLTQPSEDGITFCDIDLVRVDRKTVYMVTLNQSILDLELGVVDRIVEQSGFAVPCLIPPQDWTGEEGVGGFYGDLRIRATRFFKGTSEQYNIMMTEGSDNTVVLRALNAHQKVAWKINPFILNLLEEMRRRGFSIPKKAEFIEHHELTKPPRQPWMDTKKPAEYTTAERAKFASWKEEMREWHTKYKQSAKHSMRTALVMKAARDMKDLNEFYFVWQIDYRIREYSVSGVLNPQGADIQKALLHAAQGLPMYGDDDAIYFFKLGVASKFGYDKDTLDGCVAWFDKHQDEIYTAGKHPLRPDVFEWWTGADKPLQFVAMCAEWADFCDNPKEFKNRIAVGMDGTCNGLQNYSALFRDDFGAVATNLCGEHNSRPSDIYGSVANHATETLKTPQVGRDSPDEESLRSGWLSVGLDRKGTKVPVMTKVYGSKAVTVKKALVKYCMERGIFKECEYPAAAYLEPVVSASIRSIVSKASDAMDWLQKSAVLIMRENADYITWLSPAGTRVVQIYDKFESTQIRCHVGKEVRLRVDNVTGPSVVDKVAHRNAIAPNYIHSVDGSHAAFTTCAMVDECGAGVHLHFVHDDFGALAAQAKILYRVIREQFVYMHENYSPEQLLKEYSFIPKPPERGTFDIKRVLTSPNFFR